MTSSKTAKRLAIGLTIALGAAFLYATYTAIDTLVAEQSRVQQQSVSPVYKLVRDELLRPLYIAETFASTVDFAAELESADIDEAALLERLADMEADLGLVFFVASERARKQYLSNGRTLDLMADNVRWYFEAKAEGKDLMADLGQVGDVHLFFDVAVYNREHEFLGYVGVGKRIARFVEMFERYKAQYGYDFLFVNERNEILLTSFPELVVTGATIPKLDSLGWFEHDHTPSSSHDSEIIQIEQDDFLISEIAIEDLGWRLLLLSPLQARQAETTRAFVVSALGALASMLLLAISIAYLMFRYKRNIDKKAEVDLLTGVPNRAFIQRSYEKLVRDDETLCAIIVDLDHFKVINDTHGHDAGDRVLAAAARVFADVMREQDIVGRWGGEEFVMLIPATSVDTGMFIAERARRTLENLSIDLRECTISITASFGVAFGPLGKESFADVLARADKVLYQAKNRGRNRVIVYREAS